MKTLALCALSVFSVAKSEAEEIPLRAPKAGEARPTWWLTCWRGHIVVLRGKITYTKGKDFDVKVTVSDEARKKYFNHAMNDVVQAYAGFYIGEIEATEFLFASSAITSADANFAGMTKKHPKKIKFLVPTVRTDNSTYVMGSKSGEEGVFYFNYGSSLIPVPMTLAGSLDGEKLETANKIFAHRAKFEHR